MVLETNTRSSTRPNIHSLQHLGFNRWERVLFLAQGYRACSCTNVCRHIREQEWRRSIVTPVDRDVIAGVIIPGPDREGDGQIMGTGQGEASSRSNCQTDKMTGSSDRYHASSLDGDTVNCSQLTRHDQLAPLDVSWTWVPLLAATADCPAER